MATKYVESKELEAVGAKLVEGMNWIDLPVIKFLIKESDKSEYYGAITRVTGKWKFLTKNDYVIEVWDKFWFDQNTTMLQKEAVVFHELLHIHAEEDEDNGITKWSLVKHDLEEFRAVVERFGFILPDIKAFADSIKKKEAVDNLPPVEEHLPIEEISADMGEKIA